MVKEEPTFSTVHDVTITANCDTFKLAVTDNKVISVVVINLIKLDGSLPRYIPGSHQILKLQIHKLAEGGHKDKDSKKHE